MKNNKLILVLFLLFLIPYILIYRTFFSSSPLAWGDAPYFYPENLAQLFNKPLTWDFRNTNFGGPQFLILWLYLPTFLMGLLYQLFGLSDEILIRLIFYFPATILGFLGSFFYIRKLVKNNWAVFLGSFLYGFNTYFLLLIDGGQIGVALGYGLFPWVLLTLRNLLVQQTIKNFIFCLITFTLLTNIDLRLAILSLFTFLLINICEGFISRHMGIISKTILIVIEVIVLAMLLNGFWMVPFINNFLQGQTSEMFSPNNFLSLLNGLLLFNPHFPNNEFGHLNWPPFYFALLPILIFGGLMNKLTINKKSLYLSLLVLIFLLKGTAEPIGGIYGWFLQHIPLAEAFRDSSKFFIPTIFLSGILLSLNMEQLFFWIKNRVLLVGSFLIVYLYLILLISPGLMGQLTGTLSSKFFNSDYQIIYQHLMVEPPFFRSVWFPQVPPQGLSTQGREAINANLLYQDWPFAGMIRGDYDLFYFLHNSQLPDWWRLLGIKYAFFPPDERQKTWFPQELVDRQTFLNFIDTLPGWKKLNWPISFPVYQIANTQPKIFTQSKALIVLGDQTIYTELKSYDPNFSLINQNTLFAEDGILDPQSLFNLPSSAANLVFFNRNQEDLTFTFLQNKFLDWSQLTKSDWGKYLPNQYLQLKYELFKHGLDSQDFGFNRGLIYSSIANEKATYKVGITKDGEYLLAARIISASSSAGIKINLSNNNYIINNVGNKFSWKILGPFHFPVGEQTIEIENRGGFNAINVVSILTTQDFNQAQTKAKELMLHFPNFDLARQNDRLNLINQLKTFNTRNIDYQEKSPTDYKINLTEGDKWLVFSDHYDKDWTINGKFSPYPLYSMINGFYISEPSKLQLYFKPQDQIDIGIKVTVASILLVTGIILILKFRK
ncbi:MAG: hypothetical protein Q7R43_02900 [Candidatus Daviesbacteria bacterium]|nr:hypothetical protein [Candidatus Daviesbacteria bacterium]